MWRVPRGASILDKLLIVVLNLVAFSLPLEGMIDNYVPGNLRSLPFYLMVLGAGLAFLRLPHLLQQFFSNKGLPLITLVYAYITVLYLANPLVRSAPTILIIQLLVLAATFMYVADDQRIRRQLIWSYYIGWCILVVLSVYEFQRGNFNLYARGDFIRAADILGFSANQHARQIGAGIVMGLVLLSENNTRGLLRIWIVSLTGLGSLALLMGNSRSTLLIIIVMVVIIVFYQTFRPSLENQASVSSNSITRAFLISIVVFVIYFVYTSTELGRTLLESNLNRLQDIQEGQVGARDRLWSGSIQVALDNPFGVGSNNSMVILGREIGFGGSIDAHNYYLRVLMEGGFGGFLLFSAGLWLVFRQGWQWVVHSGDSVYFFGFIFILLVSLSGVNFHLKIAWFFLAMNAVVPVKCDEIASTDAYPQHHRKLPQRP